MSTVYKFYLLKTSVASFEEALDREKDMSRHGLAEGLGLDGALFVGQQQQAAPPWVEMLNPFLQTRVERALSASISAVLLLRYEGRIFAASFGYGKSLLTGSSWVRDFGLKVTLNRVDPGKLRSVDSKTYEDMVVSTRKQTSRGSAVAAFELDVARNLIRGVTGDTSDQTFFRRLTGSDSLALTTDLSFEDLGDLLDELLVAYQDDNYKENFDWVDNVKEVDSGTVAELDQLLVTAIRINDVDGMHLAPGDVIEWDNIAGFNFTRGPHRITYPELDLDNYIEVLNHERASVKLEDIKRHKVRVRYSDTRELQDKWSVYECLVWETEYKEKQYVLLDSRWFEVEKGYAKGVERYVQSISCPCVLPDGMLGQEEGTYNESVAKKDAKMFALLDRQTIRPDGAASPIEFCDLMSAQGHLIHVKKRSSSATLSHLFSQGSVSADAFLRDGTVRAEIRAKLRKLKKPVHCKLIPKDRPVASKYEIVYATLAKPSKKWPPKLPFFSGVNLVHHGRRIQNLGFKVSLQHVRQTKG